MKSIKLLLSVTFALLLSSALWAQGSRPAKFQKRVSEMRSIWDTETHRADIPTVGQPLQGLAPQGNTQITFREGPAFSVPLGSSYNIYSVLTEGQNSVTYNPDINSIVFCHRQNYPHPGGSGIISFDVSTDGGVTWDTTTKQVTPMLMTEDGIALDGNRYPNGTIYNPPGNDDPANAFFFGSGASLWNDPDFGSGWGWEFVASAKFDGTMVDEAYYTNADTNIYLPFGLVYNVDGSIWHANYRREENLSHQLLNPVILGKFTFNETANSFGRTAIELPLNYSEGRDSFAFNPRIAFSPDGQTGYAVIAGIDGDDPEVLAGSKPIVWKTMDGGDTWDKQPRVMWQELDSLIAYTIPIDADGDGTSDDPAGDSPRIPFTKQFDIAVDDEGMLHLIAELSGHTDTASNTYWAGEGVYEFFHLITDGTTWRERRIGGSYNSDADFGAATSTLDARVQASRSEDGEFIFFTFAQTYYEEVGEDQPNTNPDIYGVAYSVERDSMVGPRNFGLVPGTVFDDFEFTDVVAVGYFHHTSPVAITGGAFWDLELPIIYGIPRGTPDDPSGDLLPIDFYFLRSAGFDYGEFGITSTEEVVPADYFQLQVQPNPAQGEALASFALENNARYTLSLLNIVGQKVMDIETALGFGGANQAGFDVAGLTPGLYLLRLQAENKVAVAKLLIK